MDRAIVTLRQLSLVAGDLLIFCASLAAALWLRNIFGETHLELRDHVYPFAIIFILWVAVFYISGFYDLALGRNRLALLKNAASALLAAAAVAIAFFYLVPQIGIAPKTTLFLDLGLTAITLPLWRILYDRFLTGSRLRRRIIFVGLNDEARELIGLLKENPQLGLDVVAAIALDGSDAPGVPVRRTLDGFRDFLRQENVSTVVLSLSPRTSSELADELYESIFLKIDFVDVINFYETITRRVPVSAISRIWFLENLQESRKNLYEILKRGLDIAGAALIGVFTLAITPFVAILIWLSDRGPIFFSQERVGKDGRRFWVKKFRTMIVDAEKDGARYAEKNDSRITTVGKILRLTRIDELPQCLNVLLGEMSFIGPRPERPEFAEEITRDMPYYPMRLLVRPGLSGWAQINYPYYATPAEQRLKLQYDLFYIKNRSFFLDLLIAMRTLNTILRAKGQ
jgi:exopolysaccharide biosynthesis polyprenyl glycosylphosphotransferase